MANEYLRRTPTSTGNNRVFTWSGWVKRNIFAANYAASQNLFRASGGSGGDCGWRFDLATPADSLRLFLNGAASGNVQADGKNRDASAWMHVMLSFNSTLDQDSERARIYVNGVRVPDNNTGYPTINYQTSFNERVVQAIGAWDNSGSPTEFFGGELTDVFFIDGQALTPDVFGFYKQGKGYISVGSTQATDFRPGQWVPKTPRVIKTEINRRGGFGVNGFYLPMNDSKNFGADFHCDPNSIITLNEKLPQPRVGVATTASVGIGYTDALRADPYAANLVLALPFVSGGLSSGFGDYSAVIKGSGSAKTLVWNSGSVTPSIGNTGVYYGSGGNFPGGTVGVSTSADFKMDGSFTVESWFFSNSFNSGNGNHIVQYRNGLAGSDNWVLSQGATGSIRFLLRNDNGTNAADLDITNTGITTNQWYHFVGVYNDTNKTSTVYLNGVTIGIATNISWTRNNGTTLLIGSNSSGPTGAVGDRNINGYLQDFRIYKGVAKYTGGFDVPRPYTPVGIATWRAVPDTTANNFATLNAIGSGILNRSGGTTPSATYSNGNLTVVLTEDSSSARSTIGVSTGKWYWEVRYDVNSNSPGNGIVGLSSFGTSYDDVAGVSYEPRTDRFRKGNQTFYDGTNNQTSNGLIVGVALDKNVGIISFFADGVNQTNGTITGINTLSEYHLPECFTYNDGVSNTFSWNFGQNPTFSGNTTAGTFTDSNGKGLFKYQPPSGFLALCEDNLPTPAIANPDRHFKTVLYTGDGNSGRSIVGVGFTPDLVWIKSRNAALYHLLTNSVTGVDNTLSTNTTDAESFSTERVLNSFDSDGFSLNADDGSGYYGWNVSGQNYVAWCWRAGAGTTSTNTNGSVTSVVSVNQDAGFSIVSYTGTGAQGTLGHGLGRTPKFIVMKRRNSTNNWSVYHSSLGLSHTTYPNWLYLNLTSAEQNSASSANHPLYQRPSDSLIYLNTGTSESTNVSTSTYVAYCWAEIEGFSKAFSYVGNGSADGPMIYLGLKPALIIIKRTDNVGNWQIYDSSRMSTNPNNGVLFPNLSNVEGTGSAYDIDFLSNGFKLRSTDTDRNASGSTYVGFAWAESPFQTANSK